MDERCHDSFERVCRTRARDVWRRAVRRLDHLSERRCHLCAIQRFKLAGCRIDPGGICQHGMWGTLARGVSRVAVRCLGSRGRMRRRDRLFCGSLSDAPRCCEAGFETDAPETQHVTGGSTHGASEIASSNDTDSSPSPALRHRVGLHNRDCGDRAHEVLVTAAAAADGLATLAHPIGIRRVAPATAHSARFLLAGSDPNARRLAPTSSKILTPPATEPAGILGA